MSGIKEQGRQYSDGGDSVDVGFEHTDIGVNLGSVHGVDQLPQAFLVAVHLPVSTNEEFPGHDCGFVWGVVC